MTTVARKTLLLCAILSVVLFSSCGHSSDEDSIVPFVPRDTQRDGFVYVQGHHFMLDGEPWFPLTLNYKTYADNRGDSIVIAPAPYYLSNSAAYDFAVIADMGFNSIRLCVTGVETADTAAMYKAFERIIDSAAQNNLRVMLLLDPPFDSALVEYTSGLLRHFADNSTLWAYDFFNEPLYFDPKGEDRTKMEAYNIVSSWREMMCQNAPNQLFTVAFSEPIEVFEWDPTIMPVDFVEMHTYHPLRVASEMYWYSNVITNKPWMVGETSLPVDNDSVDYDEQLHFMRQAFVLARSMGAAGFGWWGYVDCTGEVNFEGKYTALINSKKEKKPAAHEVKNLMGLLFGKELAKRPPNYYNMLGYNNICLKGQVIDENTGKPVCNALIRGWTEDWIGMNTYSDSNGNFTLYSNDLSVHFEVSAPGMHTKKFDDHTLSYTFADSVPNHKWQYKSFPNKSLEYQSIDYHPFLEGDSLVLVFNPHFFNQSKAQGNIGTIKLKCIKISDK